MELSVQEFRGLLIETIARWRSLHKDLRFGQFLSCAIGDRDLFLVEDDEMARMVREKFEEFEFEVADQEVEYGERFVRKPIPMCLELCWNEDGSSELWNNGELIHSVPKGKYPDKSVTTNGEPIGVVSKAQAMRIFNNLRPGHFKGRGTSTSSTKEWKRDDGTSS